MSSQFKTNRLHSRLMSRVLERWHWALLLICLCFGSYFGLRASTDTTSPVRSGPVASATAPAQPQTKSIEEIQAGDLVMARDDVTGEVAPKRVAQVFRNTSDHLRILTIRNANGITQEIQTTNEHPFYVPDSGWTSAGELTPGTKLLQMDEQLGVVVLSRFEEHPEGVPVFNFEVEDYHTYYVADQPTRGPPSGLLAHNSCYDDIADLPLVNKVRAGAARPPRHHIFPQEHRQWFKDRGFAIDKVTAPLDQGTHSALHTMGWNEEIMERLLAAEAKAGRQLKPKEIWKEGYGFMREWGLRDVPLLPFVD